jgi:outer membrane receptor protein involved in Fe transport
VFAILDFVGFTNIDQSSAGYRAAMTWGEDRSHQLTLGTDFRYLDGELKETDQFLGSSTVCANGGNFGVPDSHQSNVGIFLEDTLPFSDRFVIKTGGRVDWTNSNVNSISMFDCTSLDPNMTRHMDFERDFTMFLAYAQAQYKLTEELSIQGGFGRAQRPPTTTELYAVNTFLAVLQNGLTSVNGNPDLASEKLYQIDLSLKADFKDFRAGVSGFYSFINDYITYRVLQAGFKQTSIDLSQFGQNSLTVQYINTALATLAGFEVYAETDVTDWLTPYATIGFVEGRDITRQMPLPGIAPLDSRVGLRAHERRETPRYGVDWSARMVAPQNRVASALGEVRTPGFTVFDIRSYWQIRKGILLTAGIENMFDRFYREHLDLRTGLGVYQPGIQPYLGLELRY